MAVCLSFIESELYKLFFFSKGTQPAKVNFILINWLIFFSENSAISTC